jgi:hypothetical protein
LITKKKNWKFFFVSFFLFFCDGMERRLIYGTWRLCILSVGFFFFFFFFLSFAVEMAEPAITRANPRFPPPPVFFFLILCCLWRDLSPHGKPCPNNNNNNNNKKTPNRQFWAKVYV